MNEQAIVKLVEDTTNRTGAALDGLYQRIEEFGLVFKDSPRFAGINLANKDGHGRNKFKGKARRHLKLLHSQRRRGIS